MHWLTWRALCGAAHARTPVVTASVDYMNSYIPCTSATHRPAIFCEPAFRTSMEVGVKVWVEDLLTGERQHTSSAYPDLRCS